jgi:hypothetical protein
MADHKGLNDQNQGNTDKSTNYFGRSKQQVTFDLIKWIFGVLAIVVSVAIAWGKLETISHSEETYVRKDIYIQGQKTNDDAHAEMKEMLKEIRDYQINKKH